MDAVPDDRPLPWWQDGKMLILVLLTTSFCLILLGIAANWFIRGPAAVPDEARDAFIDMMQVLIGVLAGYLLGRPINGSPKR